jgi:TfoX/Sxy family transcriptional regulator of competence genes
MAYNEKFVDRIREIISLTHENVVEKKMFGGMCFMVDDKMCVGVQQERLMLRLDPLIVEEVLEKDGCVNMQMKGKVMKGFVLVNEDVLNTKKKLSYWLNLALEYNKFAKASKKRK